MSSRALERLSEIIRQKAAHVILFELKDPRLGFLTITRVKLAADLSVCRVFWSIMGSEADRNKAAHALESASGFIQRRVGSSLRTRTVPHFEFEYDESVEGAIRVSSLLRQTQAERGEEPSDQDSEPSDADCEPGDGDDAAEDDGGERPR